MENYKIQNNESGFGKREENDTENCKGKVTKKNWEDWRHFCIQRLRTLHSNLQTL
jgi:hypothetical protein